MKRQSTLGALILFCGMVALQPGPARGDDAPGADDRILTGRKDVEAADDRDDQMSPAHDKLLARRLWREGSYGISLRPPLGANQQMQTGDRAMVRFELPDHTAAMSLSVRRSREEIDIHHIAGLSLRELGMMQPGARTLSRKQLAPGGRPGKINYYLIDRGKGKQPRVMGHAFLQIDTMTFAFLRLDAMYDEAKLEQLKAIFEAVFASIRITSPAQLEARRKRLLAAGEQWRSPLTPEDWKNAVVPDQLYRYRIGDRDIGWMRVWMAEDIKQLKTTGIAIDMKARFYMNDHVNGRPMPFIYDSEWACYVSYRGLTEFWSSTSTRREINPGRGRGEQISFNETGLLGREKVNNKMYDMITLTRESRGTDDSLREPPKDPDKHALSTGGRPEVRKWRKPEQGYLTQVEKELFGRLMRGVNEEKEMAFYCYYSSRGDINLRTEHVIPQEDGGYIIHTRLAPDEPQQTTRYDAQGNFIERTTPDGTRMTPTTARELQAVWKNKFDAPKRPARPRYPGGR